MFSRIFSGLELNSSVAIQKVIITIVPYNAKTDQLSMIGNPKNPLDLAARALNGGMLEISNPGNPVLKASDWNNAINFPAYRLNIDVRPYFE